jgi:putative tricarboxylic transport membrane protein
VSRGTKDIVSGVVLLGLAIAMLVAGLGIKRTLLVGVGSGFGPSLVALLLAWVSTCILAQGLAARSTQAAEPPEGGRGDGRRTLATFVLIAVYVALLEKVGFLIMTFAYLVGQFLVMAPPSARHPLRFVAIGALVVLVSYYTFVKGFDLMLPAGLFP